MPNCFNPERRPKGPGTQESDCKSAAAGSVFKIEKTLKNQAVHSPMKENKSKIVTQFSHVVIFWTEPADVKTADELIAGAEKYLRPIPGVLSFHIGKMAASHRPVVDQSYQVALNIIFPNKKAQDEYQTHPLHIEFVEKILKPRNKKVVVYDFE